MMENTVKLEQERAHEPAPVSYQLPLKSILKKSSDAPQVQQHPILEKIVEKDPNHHPLK